MFVSVALWVMKSDTDSSGPGSDLIQSDSDQVSGSQQDSTSVYSNSCSDTLNTDVCTGCSLTAKEQLYFISAHSTFLLPFTISCVLLMNHRETYEKQNDF